MSAEPVESRAWWWLRATLVSTILGAIATGIAFGIRARSHMGETGQGLDLGRIADLMVGVLWVWPTITILALLNTGGWKRWRVSATRR